uniref:Uncharacterized protein n=1 Tax=Rhizophora mucronata TaxID=61149 RepID=A0A2P2QFX7_RHIMU
MMDVHNVTPLLPYHTSSRRVSHLIKQTKIESQLKEQTK